MKFAAILLAGAATLLSASAQAQSVTNASGSGWCNSDGTCNNTSTNSIANHFAGNINANYHNWFAFQLPTGNYSSANLSIWNSAANYTTSGGTFNLYGANDISYNGLVSGNVLGSYSVAAADNGDSHYVDIALNSAGLSALNGSSGKLFVFGGDNNGGDQIFGYTNGTPVARLTTIAAAVPEPATWAMMLAGFGMIGFAARRRQSDKTTVRFA